MIFDSLDEVVRYVEGAVLDSMPDIGKYMMEIMEEALLTDIYLDHEPNMYDRTGDLLNTPKVVDYNKNGIIVEYNEDGGSWTSYVGARAGEHFFPLAGYEVGKVWAPAGGYYEANPVKTALENCEKEIPNDLKRLLREKGIPVY